MIEAISDFGQGLMCLLPVKDRQNSRTSAMFTAASTTVKNSDSIVISDFHANPELNEDVAFSVQMTSLREPAPIRTELVQQMRAKIAAGQYLTPDKIESVVDVLYDELFWDRVQ